MIAEKAREIVFTGAQLARAWMNEIVTDWGFGGIGENWDQWGRSEAEYVAQSEMRFTFDGEVWRVEKHYPECQAWEVFGQFGEYVSERDVEIALQEIGRA